jgi:hypothetical protein
MMLHAKAAIEDFDLGFHLKHVDTQARVRRLTARG